MNYFKQGLIVITIILLGNVSGKTLYQSYQNHHYHSNYQAQLRSQYSRQITIPHIQAYLKSRNQNQLTIQIVNLENRPFQLLNLTIGTTSIPLPTNTVLTPMETPFQYQSFTVTVPETAPTFNTQTPLYITYTPLLSSAKDTSPYQAPIRPWAYLNTQFLQQDFLIQPFNINSHPNLTVNHQQQTIQFNTKHVTLSQSIKVPPGYQFIVRPDTTIDLINHARILSYSPLQWIGTQKQPIIITSSDNTGEGVIVLNAPKLSKCHYVIFSSLLNTNQNGWTQTGAVVFYQSDVQFEHCLFENNIRGDDFLNIFRSQFTISHCQFQSILSDAFDTDFSKGSVTHTVFSTIGNDAIDVSGTEIGINHVTITHAGDKGISAG